MAFDFLGTFTNRMWNSFKVFTSNTVRKHLVGFSSSSVEYDAVKHEFKQRHVPRVRDHEIAQIGRLNFYYQKIQTSQRKRFSKLNPNNATVFYPPASGKPTFPLRDKDDQVRLILKDYYPNIRNDDYVVADIVMYIKSRISRIIKSRLEKEDYRVKRCLDYIDTTFEEHTTIDVFANDSKGLISLQSLVSQIDSSFKDRSMPNLIESQNSVDPLNLDGQGSSSTESAIAESLQKGKLSPFVIPGEPQKLIYRGQLYQRKEQVGTTEMDQMLSRLAELQNPLLNQDDPDFQ